MTRQSAWHLYQRLWLLLAILLYLPFPALLLNNIIGTTLHPNHIWTDDAQLLPQAFFAMFWFSGMLLWRHFCAVHGLGQTATPFLDQHVHVQLATSAPFHLTWLYPPLMGLLSLLYACLPLALSFWVWRGLYLLIAAASLRRAGLGWAPIWLGLLGPASVIDFIEGENGTLTGGLAVSALLLMHSAPRTAGVLAACLGIKPQTALAFPFILLRRRQWPALPATIGFGLLLVLLTLPFFGIEGWRAFFLSSSPAASGLAATSLQQIFPVAGATLLYMLRSFGVPLGLAGIAQLAVFAGCAIALWRLWARPGRPAIARMAASMSLGALMMPYGYLHDMVGFSLAMMAMAFQTSPARRPVYVGLWLFAGHSATLAALSGHILMPLAALIGALMAWREAVPQTPPHAHNPASAGPALHPGA